VAKDANSLSLGLQAGSGEPGTLLAMNDKVHLLREGERVNELWGRVTPARFNDYEVHVNRVKGQYVWHALADTDDVLMVLSGRLIVQLGDREVELGPGEMFVVPAGVDHRRLSGRVRYSLAGSRLGRGRPAGREPPRSGGIVDRRRVRGDDHGVAGAQLLHEPLLGLARHVRPAQEAAQLELGRLAGTVVAALADGCDAHVDVAERALPPAIRIAGPAAGGLAAPSRRPGILAEWRVRGHWAGKAADQLPADVVRPLAGQEGDVIRRDAGGRERPPGSAGLRRNGIRAAADHRDAPSVSRVNIVTRYLAGHDNLTS